MKEQTVVDDLHYAMNLDALESSHPISYPVDHADEISGAIAYAKGKN